MSEEIPLHKRIVMSSVQPIQQHKTKTSFTGQPTQQQRAAPKSSSSKNPSQQRKTVSKGSPSKKAHTPDLFTGTTNKPIATTAKDTVRRFTQLQTTISETSSTGQPTQQQRATPNSSSTNHPPRQRKTTSKESRRKKPTHTAPSTHRPPQQEQILSKDWDSEWPKLQTTVSEAKTLSHDQPIQQRKTSSSKTSSKQRPKQNKTTPKASPSAHQTMKPETETGNQTSSGRSRSSKCNRGWVNSHLHTVASALTILSTLRSYHAVCIPIAICTLGVRGDTRCVFKGRHRARYYGSDRDRDYDNVNICEWDEDGDIYNRIKSSKKLTSSTSTGDISRRTNRNKSKIKKQKQDTVRTLRRSQLQREDNDMGCYFDDD